MMVGLRIKNHILYGSFITILLMTVGNSILYFCFDIDPKNWLELFTVLFIVAMIENVFVIRYAGYRLFCLATIFVILSYLFSFGQVVINVFFEDYVYVTSNFIQPLDGTIKNSLMFCFNVIQCVVIGMLVISKNKVISDSSLKNIEKVAVRRLGIIICILSVPIRLYYIYKLIIQTSLNGYKLAVVENVYGVYIQLSYFCIIGYVLLMLSYDSDKIKARAIFVVSLFLLGMELLSGGRIFAVISIIILLYCYLLCIDKPNARKLVLLFLVGALGLKILTVITVLRTTNDFNISTILNALLSSDSNFILSILDEFGSTFFTVYNTLREVPTILEYHCGLSYLKAWALVLPNFNGWLELWQKSIEYPVNFSLVYAYGGSYIGELYYNFGYMGILISPLVGLLIGMISNKVQYYLLSKMYCKLAYWIMPMFASLMWIRGYANVFTRSTIWAIILIYVISRFMKKRNSDL